MKYSAAFVVISLFAVASVFGAARPESPAATNPVRVGWIGAMTGNAAKYGAYESAQLAVADINASGGIHGRPLELVYQDGRCNARDTLSAAQHLINSQHVKFLVGGHCSTESLVIAPIAQREQVLMMAAITSSPKLSDAGDMIFRVTAPNTEGAKLLANYASTVNAKRVGIVFEETEYAQGLAEAFAQYCGERGIAVVDNESYQTGEADYRALMTRVKSAQVDIIYLSVQSPDAAVSLLRTAKELGIGAQILGNEITGNAVQSAGPQAFLFDQMVFAEPFLDSSNLEYVRFKNNYLDQTKANALPSGFYTAEAYDAVRVLASAIAEAGDDPKAVAKHLQELSYNGVSGSISFDSNGDGVRTYVLKQIRDGDIGLLFSKNVETFAKR